MSNAMRRRLPSCAYLAIAGALVLGTMANAAAAATIPPEVARYQAALRTVQAGAGHKPLQPLFELGMTAAIKLQDNLENLSDEEFASAQARMKGFTLNRDEAVFVIPQIKFFKLLAQKNGLPADVAFFDIYGRTDPDGNWVFPAFVRQQTDVTGCTIYDGKLLTSLYRGWLDFRKSYPSDYQPQADDQIARIENALTIDTCACGSEDAVISGLESFAKAFPDQPIAAKVTQRIKVIRAGDSPIRFDCVTSG